MPKVQAVIQAHEAEVRKKYEITQEKILDELHRIAFFDFRDLMREDRVGLSLKPWAEIDPDASRAIASISESESSGESGSSSSRTIKAHCKVTALLNLGKRAGLWKDGRANDAPTEITLKYSLDKDE